MSCPGETRDRHQCYLYQAPTDACNTGGVGENVAGGPSGLDNDGNNVYDFPDCDTIFRNGFQF